MMTIDESINTIICLKQYYNDKNQDSYVGFHNEDNEALDMATRALEIIKGMEEIFLQELPKLDMRDATEEERNSLNHYIDSISKSTGLTIDNVQDYREPDFNVKEWLSSFNTESATVCFTEIQELKKKVEKENE